MVDSPLISIVLPVWNGERYLAEALDSILLQTLTNFELIIVNDCSTDQSERIARSYASRDSRIRLVTNEQNLKLPASLNRGFSLARGRYYTWTSDDNRLLPNCLHVLHKACIEQNVDIVFSRYQCIDCEGSVQIISAEKRPLSSPLENLLYANIIGASFLYKSEVHHSLNGYRTDLFLVEDYDFWVRSYLNNFQFYFVDENLYEYRVHSSSLTGKNRIQSVLIPFLYSIRNKFPHASAEAQFRNRSYLLTEGVIYLSFSQRLLVLFESLRRAPFSTCKGLVKHIFKKYFTMGSC